MPGAQHHRGLPWQRRVRLHCHHDVAKSRPLQEGPGAPQDPVSRVSTQTDDGRLRGSHEKSSQSYVPNNTPLRLSVNEVIYLDVCQYVTL